MEVTSGFRKTLSSRQRSFPVQSMLTPYSERYRLHRVWEESDASVDAVAAQLFCHPNTVRHRLRRIEKLTGRSLSRPRNVAELCLAFEVRRRLM